MAPLLEKTLSRLSRDALISLCLEWAQSKNSKPYLTSNRNLLESDEEDYRHEPAENISVLKQLYHGLQSQETDKNPLSRRDIVDRIIDGDWRRGLSLQQLANIDFAYLEQNDTALRWSALKLVPLKSQNEESCSSRPVKRRKITPSTADRAHYPSILPASFVAALKSHISPLVKAHCTIHRLSRPQSQSEDRPGLVVLRLYLVPNTPFAPLSSNIPLDAKQATDPGRVMYIALPDSCPFVYVSLSGSTGSKLASSSKEGKAATSKTKIDVAATKRIILEAIPKAFSRPQERWSLENTKLTCRSLKALALLRGNGKPGTSGGCYAKFSEERGEASSRERIAVKDASRYNANESEHGVRHNGTQIEAAPSEVTVPPVPTKHPPIVTDKLISQINLRFGDVTAVSHAKLDRFHVTINDILTPLTTSKSGDSTQEKSKLRQRGQDLQSRKRKRRSLEEIENGQNGNLQSSSQLAKRSEPAPITLSFSGTDVFRGLKELAAIENGKYVALSRLPSWLTGEKGVSSVVV